MYLFLREKASADFHNWIRWARVNRQAPRVMPDNMSLCCGAAGRKCFLVATEDSLQERPWLVWAAACAGGGRLVRLWRGRWCGYWLCGHWGRRLAVNPGRLDFLFSPGCRSSFGRGSRHIRSLYPRNGSGGLLDTTPEQFASGGWVEVVVALTIFTIVLVICAEDAGKERLGFGDT